MSENSTTNSGGTTASPPPPPPQPTANGHPAFVFFLPPPPTIFVQLSDGVQLAFTPSPATYLNSVFGGGSANGDGMMHALHELFARAQSEQHGPPPTSKPFLDRLPVKTWTSNMTMTEPHHECAICLSDYEKDDTVLTLPCGHVFHKECGMPWLVEHNVCPTCRHQLPTQSEEAAAAQPEVSEQEPDQEPEEEDAVNRTSGVRRPRTPSVSLPERVVRQRVEPSELPGSVSEDELDAMMDEEASRLVQEELSQRCDSTNAIEFDDVDVEELLRDAATQTN